MEKKTLYAIVAAAVLGLGAFAVMRQPEKGQRVGPPPRPVPAFKAADVAHIEATTEKQEKTVLDKKGTEWRVTAPNDWPADQQGVKSLVEGAEKLAFADMVTESPEKFADMGVADGKATRLAMKDAGGKVLVDMLVGKAIGGYTMVRPVGKNEVWQSTGIYGYMMNREPKAWRDHTVLEFTQTDADKLTVDAGAQKLVLEKIPAEKDKPGSETKWKIAESTGDGPKTSEALDVSMVNGALQSMATLKAVDFADDKKPEDTGLAKPWLTVTAHAAGKDHTLLIGTLVGDSVYVKNSASPVLYSVNKYAVERVAHKPADYKDKTLAKVKEPDIASLDVAFGGDPWTVDRGNDGRWKGRGKNIDDTKLKSIVNSFDNLQADGFSDEKDPARTGLAKPAALITLHLRDKSTVALKLGNLTPDGLAYYAQKVGSPDVMKVKKFVGDRVMKKAADMAPGAKPAGAMTPQDIIAADHAKKNRK